MKTRGKFKIRQLNPCGRFEGTNLHFISELREFVARKMKKIMLTLVGIPQKLGRAILKC